MCWLRGVRLEGAAVAVVAVGVAAVGVGVGAAAAAAVVVVVLDVSHIRHVPPVSGCALWCCMVVFDRSTVLQLESCNLCRRPFCGTKMKGPREGETGPPCDNRRATAAVRRERTTAVFYCYSRLQSDEPNRRNNYENECETYTTAFQDLFKMHHLAGRQEPRHPEHLRQRPLYPRQLRQLLPYGSRKSGASRNSPSCCRAQCRHSYYCLAW